MNRRHDKIGSADHQLMQSFKYRNAPPAPPAPPLAPSLPMAVDHVVCAALNLADIEMTVEQRALADRIYELANQLELTYEDQS
jgi:hypothetical protein